MLQTAPGHSKHQLITIYTNDISCHYWKKAFSHPVYSRRLDIWKSVDFKFWKKKRMTNK